MLRTILAASLLALPLSAAMDVTFTSSLASPQLVGTSVTFTATATDTTAGTIDYRFNVSANGGAYQIVQDYDVSNVFTWTQSAREGSFNIMVTARNYKGQDTAAKIISFILTSRVTVSGGAPLVSTTPNPLVAYFSAPGCATGTNVRVRFAIPGSVQRTAAMACTPNASSNFYVAGMLPNTTYTMNYELVKGSTLTSGPLLQFTTGSVDPTLTFPATSVVLSPSTDPAQSVLLIDACTFNGPPYYFPYATNLAGQIIWYYPALAVATQPVPYNMRPVTGGTILLLVNDPTKLNGGQQLFREIDLAGNTIRTTSATRVSQQLLAIGKYSINSFSHDIIRLPNGHTILIASQEKIFPAGTQGSAAPVDILGNAIVDLDTNLQVAWSWSAYDFLDINRPAVLGETCTNQSVGCPPLVLAPIANDWIHGNSLNYYPGDGSILFSSRHQDWVYKIDYGSGTGSGNVLWTLGLDGDFTMTGTTDPYPWFSHQHDAEFEQGGNTLLSLYDNGNTRISENPGENSRGQALILNQNAMTASLAANVDMGVFSIAVGSAQLLDNGNYHFDSGWISTTPTTATAQSVEVTPAGTPVFQLNDATVTYRTYRMVSFYSLQ